MTTVDGTTSLVSLLHDRYGSDTSQFDFIETGKVQGKSECGRLIVPRVLGLDHQGVSCLGNVAELADICGAVTELDLAHNSIADWTEVIQLLTALPRLQQLNLSDNPLCRSTGQSLEQVLLDDGPNSEKLAACQVSRLVLNRLQLPWDTVWTILGVLPNVCELHLSINSLVSVDPPPDGATFPTVEAIYLNHNGLFQWSHLSALGHALPNLRRLVMIDNPVQTLCDDPVTCAQSFPTLTHLNLTRSRIDSWEQVASLSSWPQLSDVHLQDIPLYQDYTPEHGRQLTIGYLPALSKLNRTSVTPTEREDAERAFIRHYMDQQTRPARYDELHDVYGDLEALAKVDLRPEDKVTVTLNWGTGRSCLKEVNPKWTLKELKRHLEKIVNLPSKKMFVFHRELPCNQGDTYMKIPHKCLHSYRVRDGDELFVYDSL